MAEKVETQEQFTNARAEGFSLVQGFYFCRPVLLENRGVPSNWLSQVEILRQLQYETLNLRKLTELVKRDPSLTYRLLRLINSPICAMQQEVTSIQTALLAVGEETFRPHGHGGNHQRDECRANHGIAAHGVCAGAILRDGLRA